MLKTAMTKAALFSAVSATVLCGVAAAQGESSSTVKGLGDDEIVVTANRREENVQDVSASVTAFSQDEIERKGFDSFDDFARQVPGLTFNEAIKNKGVFNIRGLALNVGGGNQQDTVSVYINEAPVVVTYAANVTPDLRLFDVERIEVLRGPQGTLFGSGSLGGTVRIITNKPDATKAEAAGLIDLGTTEGGGFRQRYNAMVNVPLVKDELALRVVGYYRNEDGWVDNVAIGTDNSTKDWGGRASLQWTPTENFLLRAEVIHQESKPADGDSWNPVLGKNKKSSSIPEGRQAVLTNYNLTAEYEFDGFASLTSSTTYQTTSSDSKADSGDLFGLGLPFLSNIDLWDSEFIIQELRLVSNTDLRLEWVVGGFFNEINQDIGFYLEVPGIDDYFGGAIGGDAFFDSLLSLYSREIAGYADVSYALTDRLKLKGGVRVFYTEASYEEADRDVLDLGSLTYVNSGFKNADSGTDYTWRAGLSYDVTDGAMVYANVSKGFRIGQVNPNNGPSFVDPTDIVIPEGYGPDSTLNYEIGAKTSWFDGMVVANIAAFYIDWTDIQIDGSRVSDMLNFTANAGNATSKGVELEFTAQPTDELSLYSSVTYQDAKIEALPTNIFVVAAVGDELPGLVNFKYAGGFEYTRPISSDMSMYVRMDGQYVGSSPNRLAAGGAAPFFAMNEAYVNLDAAFGLVTDWGEVALYGENLTDNDAYILNNGGATPNPVNTLRPRTGGIRFSFKY